MRERVLDMVSCQPIKVDLVSILDYLYRAMPGLQHPNYHHLVKAAINEVLAMHQFAQPAITHHLLLEAADFNPRHLMIYFAFKNWQSLANAQGNGLVQLIRQNTLDTLLKKGYPEDYIRPEMIGFVTQEMVDDAATPFSAN